MNIKQKQGIIVKAVPTKVQTKLNLSQQAMDLMKSLQQIKQLVNKEPENNLPIIDQQSKNKLPLPNYQKTALYLPQSPIEEHVTEEEESPRASLKKFSSVTKLEVQKLINPINSCITNQSVREEKNTCRENYIDENVKTLKKQLNQQFELLDKVFADSTNIFQKKANLSTKNEKNNYDFFLCEKKTNMERAYSNKDVRRTSKQNTQSVINQNTQNKFYSEPNEIRRTPQPTNNKSVTYQSQKTIKHIQYDLCKKKASNKNNKL